jgi:ribonuclease R
VALEETGADGLLPIGLLPNDFYDHDDRRHALVGRRWGRVFDLGAPIVVKLAAAAPLTGGLTKRKPKPQKVKNKKPKKSKRR